MLQVIGARTQTHTTHERNDINLLMSRLEGAENVNLHILKTDSELYEMLGFEVGTQFFCL